MKQEKYARQKKQLCSFAESFMDKHLNNCVICKESFEEYNRCYGHPVKPMCKILNNWLCSHIEECMYCKQANDRHNEDAIPLTNDMRNLAFSLGHGKIPDITTLKKAKTQLFDLLEIKAEDRVNLQDKANEFVSKSFQNKKTNVKQKGN